MSWSKPTSRQSMITIIKECGYSGLKIGERYKVRRGTYCHWLNKWGLRLTPALRYHSDDELRRIIGMFSHLEDLYVYLNINRSQLKDNLRKRGLQTGYHRHHRRLVDMDSEVLERMYRESGYNLIKMAATLGVSRETVQRELIRRGIKTHRGFSRYSWDAWELNELHVVQGYSTWAIADLFGSSERGVRVAMDRYGVPRVNNHKNGRVPTCRPERHLTDEAWDSTPI